MTTDGNSKTQSAVADSANSSSKTLKKSSLFGGGDGGGVDFDLERWTRDYGPLILVVAVIVLTGVGGFFGYKAYKKSHLDKDLAQVYEVKKGSWKSYQDKKITDEEMKQKFTQLLGEIDHKKVLLTMGIELAEQLHRNHKTALAIEVLAPLQAELKDEQEENFFISRQLVPLYEDQKEWNKAISLLEENLKSNLKWMEAKNYFDLGRLYRLSGNTQKSKDSFQYVIDHFPDDALARLARLYLN